MQPRVNPFSLLGRSRGSVGEFLCPAGRHTSFSASQRWSSATAGRLLVWNIKITYIIWEWWKRKTFKEKAQLSWFAKVWPVAILSGCGESAEYVLLQKNIEHCSQWPGRRHGYITPPAAVVHCTGVLWHQARQPSFPPSHHQSFPRQSRAAHSRALHQSHQHSLTLGTASLHALQ